MKITETLSRIKWSAVVAALIVVMIIAIIYANFNPFGYVSLIQSQAYKGSGDLKIRSGANPDTIKIEGKSTIWVEIKNTGEKNHNVLVNLTTYDEKLKFLNSYSGNITERVSIGPMESRKLEFTVKLFEVKYGGDYGIDITVNSDKNLESINDMVFLHVTSLKE